MKINNPFTNPIFMAKTKTTNSVYKVTVNDSADPKFSYFATVQCTSEREAKRLVLEKFQDRDIKVTHIRTTNMKPMIKSNI
ncbi:MAG: hypothetical protein ACR2M6_02680 [Vampirovibrionia bacterium]